MAFTLPEADDARRFLTTHLGRDPGIVEPVGEGAWSRCFGFGEAGDERVVRFGRHREDFEKDRHAARFAREALPIPEVFAVGEALGGFFAISRRVRGEPLETLAPARFAAVLPSLLEALDALHAVDLAPWPGWGGWDARGRARGESWRDFLIGFDDDPEGRLGAWRERLRAVPEADALFTAAHARLAELARDLSVERRLVHADLINRNVLVAGDRLAGVFDWGCSFYGDFLYDWAWLEFWAPWHPGIEAAGIRETAERHFAAAGLDVPGLARRWRACAIHIGLDHLRYHAFTGNGAALAAVVERLAPSV